MLARMIVQRLLLGLLTLLLVTVVISLTTELLPGDLAEAMLGQAATPEAVEAFRREAGLDRPAHVRYLDWLGGILRGDFGTSLANGREISELIETRLANTLFLAGYAASIAVPLAITLGVIAALWRNTFIDRLTNSTALTAVSLPEFFIGYILILWLAQSGVFPSVARVTEGMGLGERLYATFLPAITLTMVVTAHMMRMTRASIINLLASPYIETAILKGAGPTRVIVVHALPNALAPIINVIALNLAYLITGVVVVEVVFVYPGLGQLMVDSVSKRDLPVVQTAALIFASVYILLNLTADLLAKLSNPRLRRKR
jgi:peptide/nickel transport system permease protein